MAANKWRCATKALDSRHLFTRAGTALQTLQKLHQGVEIGRRQCGETLLHRPGPRRQRIGDCRVGGGPLPQLSRVAAPANAIQRHAWIALTSDGVATRAALSSIDRTAACSGRRWHLHVRYHIGRWRRARCWGAVLPHRQNCGDPYQQHAGKQRQSLCPVLTHGRSRQSCQVENLGMHLLHRQSEFAQRALGDADHRRRTADERMPVVAPSRQVARDDGLA